MTRLYEPQDGYTDVRQERHRDRPGGQGSHGRGTSRDEGARATFGFSDKANLDEGTVWPVAFALKELTADDEARIGALVKKAVS